MWNKYHEYFETAECMEKVSLFESTSFNNNVTKKITEYIKRYQAIFLLLLTTTSLQKKRVIAIHEQRPLLIKQVGVFVLSLGYGSIIHSN